MEFLRSSLLDMYLFSSSLIKPCIFLLIFCILLLISIGLLQFFASLFDKLFDYFKDIF